MHKREIERERERKRPEEDSSGSSCYPASSHTESSQQNLTDQITQPPRTETYNRQARYATGWGKKWFCLYPVVSTKTTLFTISKDILMIARGTTKDDDSNWDCNQNNKI